MDEKLIIRRYRPTDEAAVVDLWSRAAKIAHPFVEGEGEGERARRLREEYLVKADNWVAECQGEAAGAPQGVVGLLGLLGSEIGGLFVAPEAQGRGIGRALVEHAAALHGTVTLDVYEGNSRGRGFYSRMGFEEIGRGAEEETGHILITLRRTAAGDGEPESRDRL
ncbi:GNAT family N-acetyltransferase [Microtetraspora niveoalba]|uniref:GNAT family N-acetyltransferase n=1 Tax=Microtetraspora niveoalba TaxID=46175 RepID=UPI0008313468|nr:GNAT family N-acetyltransferase [Microtetraspora niveoalba]